MKIKLLAATPLSVSDIAICKCYANETHNDLDKIQKRINRVANVSKHASTIEHLSYSFDIDGISRACLQELARHRVASYTVKSSRYTLQELKNEEPFIWEDEKSYQRAKKYIHYTEEDWVDCFNIQVLENLRQLIKGGVPNDVAKYCMPEAYKTSLVMTINARSLQNFLELRTSRHALKEIRDLANSMFDVIPEEHKFLFKEKIND